MLEIAQRKIQDAINHLKGDLAKIRTGRASPSLIEKVSVDVYGGSQRLTIEELGQITVSDPQHLVVSPWDKSIVEEIANGLARANLGVTPVADNDVIRIAISPLTEERRREFIRLMHQTLEKYRVEIRQIRQEEMSELKNKKESGNLSEDDSTRLQKELQQLVDKHIEEIEIIGKNKEEELLQI